MDEVTVERSQVITLLFTDLVGSTELLHQLGDDEAEQLRQTHFRLLREAVAGAGGREVKNLGDGLMVAFPSPARALLCAAAIQTAVAGHNQRDPHRRLQVRIGVHTGPVVEDDGDYFGRGVVVASRLCAAAIGEEILASQAVREEVGTERGFRFSPLARLHLKGVPEPVAAVAVAWRSGEIAPPSARRPSLGLPGNAFVGRQIELDALAALLGEVRLVTLTGAGGIGKSRLALHVAEGVAERYPDGVHLCELASLADGGEVDRAVGLTLRVEETADRRIRERIVEFLLTKRVLLVLDNCEHVLGGVASLVDAILRSAPDVDMLATSRERLGVEGERRYPIGALATPDQDDPTSPAVVLFADRATAVRPGFSLTNNLAAVCELCRRLDGMPLAIELAASRCVSRSPAEVSSELSQRLDALSDKRRAVDRHRSIDSVVGWSHDQLLPTEQEVFQRVAVFVGGFIASAVAAVVGDASEDVAEDLTSLVEQSLVSPQERSGGTRFSMLEPVRQNAEARLRNRALLDAARSRHAAWAAQWVEEADVGLRGSDETWWEVSLEDEFANLRAAHAWCLTHRPDDAVRIVAAMYFYAFRGGPSEIFSWADDTIERFPDSAHPLLPSVFANAALGAWRRGDLEAGLALAERGIDLAAGEQTARYAWQIAGNVHLFSGDFKRAVEAYDQAIALGRLADDPGVLVSAAGTRVMCVAFAGDLEQACADLAGVTDLICNSSGQAWCDYVEGEIRREVDPGAALALFRRSVEVARQGRTPFVLAVANLAALSCAARLGQPVDLADYAELIEHWQRQGSWSQQWITVRTLIETLTRLGHDHAAAVLCGGLLAATTASPIVGSDAERLAETLANLRRRLGEDRLDELQAEGAALGDQRTVAHALNVVRAGT